MKNNSEYLLSCILDCGTADLAVLNDVGYDLGEFYDFMVEFGVKLTLNNLLSHIFKQGVCDLIAMIHDQILETDWAIADAIKKSDLKKKEMLLEKKEALVSLHPEKDITWLCNYLGTSIRFSNNRDVYKKYLADEISQVEENIGHEIQ